MYWILFSLLATVIWAVANVGDKYIFSKWVKDPKIMLTLFGCVGLASSLIVFSVKGFSPISFPYVLLALASGLIYCFANLLYYSAIQLEDASRVVALVYLDPLCVAVLSAIFLGEVFSLTKYVGICLMVAGAVIISYKKSRGFFRFSRGLWLAIASALFYAFHTTLSKFLVDNTSVWTVFAYLRLGTFLGVLPMLYFYRRDLKELAKTGSGFVVTIGNNILGVLGILFFTIAISLGYATLTTSLTATQPFFVLIISLIIGIFYPHILKAETGKGVFLQKLLAIILMFIGVVLIT